VTVVRTRDGAVRGSTDSAVTAFKGMSYAAPPFGPRRFAGPAPPQAWDGVRDATAFGPTAPHPGYAAPYDRLLPDPVMPGEDCLTVNVWTPDPGAGGLPVMVWVHGVAFVNGSARVPIYDGTRFAQDGVVLVTFNYRLGVEGFLWLEDGVNNRGLLDQLAALAWVQENIGAFGGDPGNVTVFGESAGAMSIGALLSSPRADGLFRRAILQSGAGHHAVTPATGRLVAAQLAAQLGCAPTAGALAELSPERLLAGQVAVAQAAQLDRDPERWGEVALNSMAFEPVVDGDLLAELPIRAIAAGAGRGVDVLTGTTTEEHNLFLVPTGIVDGLDEAGLRAMLAVHGLPAGEALSVYAQERPRGTPGQHLADAVTDWFFRVPSDRLAETRAGDGRTWQYEFAWRSPRYDGRLGACHALELAFVFDTLADPACRPLAGDDPPQQVADDVHRAWVAFATAGDPGWAPYDLQRRPVMRFAAPASEAVEDPHAARRRLWAASAR
jgi:para-nitrobenzyl esterase